MSKNKKIEYLSIRVTLKEKKMLQKGAEQKEMSLSEYVRDLILGKDFVIKYIKIMTYVMDLISYLQTSGLCDEDQALKKRIDLICQK